MAKCGEVVLLEHAWPISEVKEIVLSGRSGRYWRNLGVFGALVLLSVLALLTLVFSRRIAMHYLHPARSAPPSGVSLSEMGIPFETVTLVTADGVKLTAWYTPSKNGALILLAHGYAGVRSLKIHALFARHGYGALSWDFRAHGDSSGKLCTMGLLEARDVEAALDFALHQPEVDQVGAYGASMGAAALIEAAARREEISALALEGAFTTLEEQFQRTVNIDILRPFVRFFAERETGLSISELRPIDRIATIQPRPVYILHGEADRVIPPDSGQRLYAAAGEPRMLWLEPDVGHVGMFAADAQRFEQKLLRFFAASLLSAASFDLRIACCPWVRTRASRAPQLEPVLDRWMTWQPVLEGAFA